MRVFNYVKWSLVKGPGPSSAGRRRGLGFRKLSEMNITQFLDLQMQLSFSMLISSPHSPGPVPPCIRTDTASDYRTTFFKEPEVNVPVFCIIKVITHRHRQREPGQAAEAACSAPARCPHSARLMVDIRLLWSLGRPHWQTTSLPTGLIDFQSWRGSQDR